MLTYAHPESLATTQWVADRLDDPRIRPVEVFWGSSASWGRPAYEASHIPGAVAWDFQEELQDQARRDVIDTAGLEALLSQAGIDRDTGIVLYSGLNNLLATYAFWLLKIFGHKDVRLLDGDAVITSVRPGSPGEQAGLRPGLVVQRLNGKTVEQWASEVWRIPPLHERNERKRVTSRLQEQLYGSLDTAVDLVYLDAHGEAHEVTIQRAQRDGRVVLGPEFPPFYVEFESRRLDGDIGYIRFNAFVPPIDQRFPEALESLRGTRGLIIDLRGNHGGVFPVRKGLAEQLVQERTLFCSYKGRDSIQDVYLEPVPNAYSGSLVVLIDVMSASSAEEFSGALQAIGRAVVVGERSAGICVVANVMQLPNGVVLMYPTAQTRTADGTVLEGRGVIPDIAVTLERSQLLEGIDAQLEAGINYILTSRSR